MIDILLCLAQVETKKLRRILPLTQNLPGLNGHRASKRNYNFNAYHQTSGVK